MPADHAWKRKILIADDDAQAAETLAALLRRLGHDVEATYDGTVAVAAARRIRPDIIFLDIELPGLDGFRVAEELRADASFHKTLIVAASALATDEERIRAHEVGIDVYLIKPVDTRFIESFVGDAH
jgi:DNA-binding response OmpR family regulator